MQKQNQLIIVVTLGIAALLAGLFLFHTSRPDPPQLESATLYPSDFRPLAHFELTDQMGQLFGKNQLNGNWSILFFGYTYCPDICPMTLTVMNQIDSELKKHGVRVQVIFVSVDPERDTPARLQEYLKFFNPEFRGLTDTTADQHEIKKLTASLGVFYNRPDNRQIENYLVDHSAGIFLINPDARAHALFSAPHQAAVVARDILKIINQ